MRMQEDLLCSRKQWQEHRERLATTEGELGHLSGIRDKSESLQAEMKSANSRLAAAEAEAGRARSDVERWRSAAAEADDKALALQSQLRDLERQYAEQKRQAQDLQLEVTSIAGRLNAAEGTTATLTEDKERLRALVDLREEALASERAKAQELTFQLRTIEHKSDSERQRGGVKEEELNRVRVCKLGTFYLTSFGTTSAQHVQFGQHCVTRSLHDGTTIISHVLANACTLRSKHCSSDLPTSSRACWRTPSAQQRSGRTSIERQVVKRVSCQTKHGSRQRWLMSISRTWRQRGEIWRMSVEQLAICRCETCQMYWC